MFQTFRADHPHNEAEMLCDDVLNCLQEISQKTAQTGIHMVLVAQTPLSYKPDEKNKKNEQWETLKKLYFIPNIACFTVFKQTGVELIERIAERRLVDRLLGDGDVVFYQGRKDMGHHVQTAMVETEDVDRVVSYLTKKYSME